MGTFYITVKTFFTITEEIKGNCFQIYSLRSQNRTFEDPLNGGQILLLDYFDHHF